ncbi:hypothetical protein SLA2020_276670 [Shorea laevis]
MCNQTAPFFPNKTQSHVQIATHRTVASHGCTLPLPAFRRYRRVRRQPPTQSSDTAPRLQHHSTHRSAKSHSPHGCFPRLHSATAILRRYRRARRQPPENSRSALA